MFTPLHNLRLIGLLSLLLLALLSAAATSLGEASSGTRPPAQTPNPFPFPSGRDVTPGKTAIQRMEKLREEAALIGRYRGDGRGGYTGGCASDGEKARMRAKLDEALDILQRERPVGVDPRAGDIIRSQLRYSLGLPACAGVGAVEGIFSDSLVFGIVFAAGVTAVALAAARWQQARAAVATTQPPAQRPTPAPRRQFDVESSAIQTEPRSKAPRRQPRGPIFGPKARTRPGAPARASSPPGPRYEPAPLPPMRHEIPPSPIAPAGEPIGGVGITNPLSPRPVVRNPRVWIDGGIVQMAWDPPLYDAAKERLVGYEISRQQPMPDTTGYPRVTLDVLPPDDRAWQGQHLEGSGFYHVSPLYEDVVTHQIVYGEPTPVWYR